jgi:hypothetical protein
MMQASTLDIRNRLEQDRALPFMRVARPSTSRAGRDVLDLPQEGHIRDQIFDDREMVGRAMRSRPCRSSSLRTDVRQAAAAINIHGARPANRRPAGYRKAKRHRVHADPDQQVEDR